MNSEDEIEQVVSDKIINTCHTCCIADAELIKKVHSTKVPLHY